MSGAGWARALLIAAWLVVAGRAAVAAAETERLLGAASDGHLWFVADREPDDDMVELRQHALVMDGPYLGARIPLPQPPLAVAAWDNEVWVVFPPKARTGPAEVYRAAALHDPVLDAWFAVPHDRLEVLAPLPAGAVLIALAGTADGPIALVAPPAEGQAAGVLRLEAGRWIEAARLDPDARLLAAGGAGGRQWFAIAGRGDATRLTILDAASGRSETRPLPLPGAEVTGLCRAAGQVIALTESDGDDRIHFAYLRRSGLLELAAVERPPRPWTALGLRDGLRLVVYQDGAGTFRTISARTGAVGRAVAMAPQPTRGFNVLRLPALLAIAIFAMVLAVLYRPGTRRQLALPPGTLPAAPLARLLAVLIDLVPGAVAAVLLLGAAPRDLLRTPLTALSADEAMPYMLACAITIGWSAVAEMLTGRTIGKALIGARVVGADGGRPSPPRVIVRNAVKLLVLLAPPLAVFNLVGPNLQGLADLVGRTLVVVPGRAGGRSS